MQSRVLAAQAVAAVTTFAVAQPLDVSGMDQLTIKQVNTPDAGAFAAGDAQMFLRVVSDATPQDDALIAPVRTVNDAPGGTKAAIVNQYDVRGLARVKLSVRNNHATQSGTISVDIFSPLRGYR